MKVLVAGATGAIGRPLVDALVAGGHDVVGMTRSPEKAESLRRSGAVPAVCDALDAEAVSAAVAAARPDVVVHQLTQIPHAFDLRRYAEQLAVTDRLRTEGTRSLVAAAREAGARRLVAQSVAFAYAPRGAAIKTEDEPLREDASPQFGRTLEAVRELERRVLGADPLEGLVLRYGYFYGPGTAYARDGQIAALVRRRRFPIVGGGGGIWSFVHVEDAAAATALAVERGGAGVYNVVDDDPAPVREWLPAYAAALARSRRAACRGWSAGSPPGATASR